MVKKCATCNVILQTKIVPREGHKYNSEWKIIKEPTCVQTGKKYQQCINCEAKIYEVIEKIDHTPTDDWVVTKQPTCTERGERKKFCIHCDAIVEVDKGEEA